MLAWLDLETTGLDAEKCRVLEVACVVTDDQLVEVARFERVTSEASYVALGSVDAAVQEMHLANGLWLESVAAGRLIGEARHEHELHTVDQDLHEFLSDHARGAQLAGSTISFDRSFMKQHLRYSHEVLHYRNVDVTTLNELARRFAPEVWKNRPRSSGDTHRAMVDVLESIDVCRYYVRALGWSP